MQEKPNVSLFLFISVQRTTKFSFTLLWDHEKISLEVPYGQNEPIVKKPEYNNILLQFYFLPNNISQQGFVLKYRQTGTIFSLELSNI